MSIRLIDRIQRAAEVDGVTIYFDPRYVSNKEAEEIVSDELKAAEVYYKDKSRPRTPWYIEENTPVYEDVCYILTDRGWLNDKQRADIIRQGNSSPDYEIIEPIQREYRKEIVRYEHTRKIGGTTECSNNDLVHHYWFYTGQTNMLDRCKFLSESKYGKGLEKPFEYWTDTDWETFAEKHSGEPIKETPEIKTCLESGILTNDDVEQILLSVEEMNEF